MHAPDIRRFYLGGGEKMAEIMKVPIENKVALTIPEAAQYSNIGQNKLDKLLKAPGCPFVLYVGTKKLVKRKEFERWISEKIAI